MTSCIKLLFGTVFLGCSISGFSQLDSSRQPASPGQSETPTKNNIIKLNLSALIVKNISIQYERRVGHKTSVALGIHTLPFGDVPFQSTLENIVDDPSANIKELKLGSFGITPEFRFYPGKKGVFRGLYFGPFFSYNSYKTDLPINYDYNNETRTGIFKGTVSTYTAGIQIGAQWKLGNSIYLDWWILGPNYGGASGDVVFSSTLDYYEQGALSIQLQELKDDVPLHVIKSYSVDNNGAIINFKGPWAGIRGLGINLGYRF